VRRQNQISRISRFFIDVPKVDEIQLFDKNQSILKIKKQKTIHFLLFYFVRPFLVFLL